MDIITTDERVAISARRSGGGAATSAGTTFQENAGVWLAACILAGNHAPQPFDLGAGVVLTNLIAESTNSVDDLNAGTSAGGQVYVQCKTTVTLSPHPQCEFAAVVKQFVGQLSSGAWAGESKARPLDPNRDRLVLVVSSRVAANLSQDLPDALAALRLATEVEFAEQLTRQRPTRQREVLDDFHQHADREWRTRHGDPLPAHEWLRLLRMTWIKVMDFSEAGRDRDLAATILRSVVGNPEHARLAHAALLRHMRRFAPDRSGADVGSLRAILYREGCLNKRLHDPARVEENAYCNHILENWNRIHIYGADEFVSDDDRHSRSYPLTRAYVQVEVAPESGKYAAQSVVEVMEAASAAGRAGRILFVGEAGTGKTTLVTWLSLLLAAGEPPADAVRDHRLTLEFNTGSGQISLGRQRGHVLRDPDAGSRSDAAGPSPVEEPIPPAGEAARPATLPWWARLPVLVRLRNLFDNRGQWDGVIDIERAVRSTFKTTSSLQWIGDALGRGGLLAFDGGIDEVPEAERERVVAQILLILRQYPRCIGVVTTRQSGAVRWKDRLIEDGGFEAFRILPLTGPRIRVFTDRWHDAVVDQIELSRLGAADKEDEKQVTIQRRDQIKDQLRSRPAVAVMCEVPLLGAMTCAMHRRRGELPRTERELLENMCKLLLHALDQAQLESGLPRRSDSWHELSYEDRKGIAMELAYEMTSNGVSELPAPESLPRRSGKDERGADPEHALCRIVRKLVAERFGDRADAAEAIYRDFVARGGVLDTPARNRVCFAHNVLREYFAAEWYVEQQKMGELVMNFGESGFENILVYAAGSVRGRCVWRGERQERPFVVELIKRLVRRVHEFRGPDPRALERVLVRMKNTDARIDPEDRQEIEAMERRMIEEPTHADEMALASTGDLYVSRMAWSENAAPHRRAAWGRILARVDSREANKRLDEYLENERDETVVTALSQVVSPLRIRAVLDDLLDGGDRYPAARARVTELDPIINPAPRDQSRMQQLRRLSLPGHASSDELLNAVCSSPHLPQLAAIVVPSQSVTADGVRAARLTRPDVLIYVV